MGVCERESLSECVRERVRERELLSVCVCSQYVWAETCVGEEP